MQRLAWVLWACSSTSISCRFPLHHLSNLPAFRFEESVHQGQRLEAPLVPHARPAVRAPQVRQGTDAPVVRRTRCPQRGRTLATLQTPPWPSAWPLLWRPSPGPRRATRAGRCGCCTTSLAPSCAAAWSSERPCCCITGVRSRLPWRMALGTHAAAAAQRLLPACAAWLSDVSSALSEG
jgi:hypothetical protein